MDGFLTGSFRAAELSVLRLLELVQGGADLAPNTFLNEF